MASDLRSAGSEADRLCGRTAGQSPDAQPVGRRNPETVTPDREAAGRGKKENSMRPLEERMEAGPVG